MLVLARMPAFFYLRALRLRRGHPLERGIVLPGQLGNLVYLYVLWATLVFLSTRLVAHLWWGRELGLERQLSMLWAPLGQMWFLYGLALAFLVAWLCRRLPIALVLAVSLPATRSRSRPGTGSAFPSSRRWCASSPTSGSASCLGRWSPRRRAALAALAADGLGLPALHLSRLRHGVEPVRAADLAITCTGIAGLLMLSAQIAGFSWSWPLAIVGASTLYIYVTQRVTIFYMERLSFILGEDVVNGVVIAAVVVVWGTVFGRWAARTNGFAWLFKAPWLAGTTRRASPPPDRRPAFRMRG